MTSATTQDGRPDDARLREALRLTSVPPSDDVGPESWPGEAGWDIATAADHLGISAHTLRYYERIGLVRVGRDASGRRRYDAAAVRRLVFLARMRTSGMTIRDLHHYVGMVEAGQDTVPERLAMLTEHRDGLRARIDELALALAATEYKIAAYTRQLDEQATADDAAGEVTEDCHSSTDSAAAAGACNVHGTCGLQAPAAGPPRDASGLRTAPPAPSTSTSTDKENLS